MNIQPAFLSHWKVKQLVRCLDDRAAPLYLIALWGHCQTSKAWVFEIPIGGVASICDYEGDPGILNDALVSGGWIVRNGDQITVLGWDEYNSGLVSRWSNGARGGRPKKPVDNRSITEPKPVDNQHSTGQEPIECNRIERDGIKRDGIKQDGMGWDGKQKSLQAVTDTPAKPKDYTPEFEAWWKSYPSRPGCPKGHKREAFDAWNAIGSPESHANVLQATKALSASDSLPKDAQRFLRPVRGKGDPEYIRWLDVEIVTKQRANNKNIVDNGEDIMEKLRLHTG